ADAGDFSVVVTSNAADINAANLAAHRAVVFVHSAGDALSGSQEADLQAYVEGGRGFGGIGEPATLEEGGAAVSNTLIGLTASPRTSGTDSGSQDIEFLDRVHPSSKDLPLLYEDHSDAYYAFSNAGNPTGNVHTVARARFGTLPSGESHT